MRKRLLRAALALALSAALTAPYAAALGCDAGGCCDMQMAEQIHHGTGVAFTSGESSPPCPMMVCGLAASAVTIDFGTMVPDIPVDDVGQQSIMVAYLSTTVPPHTPPPRV